MSEVNNDRKLPALFIYSTTSLYQFSCGKEAIMKYTLLARTSINSSRTTHTCDNSNTLGLAPDDLDITGVPQSYIEWEEWEECIEKRPYLRCVLLCCGGGGVAWSEKKGVLLTLPPSMCTLPKDHHTIASKCFLRPLSSVLTLICSVFNIGCMSFNSPRMNIWTFQASVWTDDGGNFAGVMPVPSNSSGQATTSPMSVLMSVRAAVQPTTTTTQFLA